MTYAMKLKEQLEEGIEIGFEKGITKGIAKGMEKGVEKGTIITLSNLVDSKLLTVEEAASQAKLSVEKFLNLKKKYLQAV